MSEGADSNAHGVDALLADLAALDIRLRVVDGKLGYDAPPGAFTAPLKERVRALRPALLARLAQQPIVAPLSSAQQRMWFINRIECRQDAGADSARGSHTEHLAYALDGTLDRVALECALSAVCARHGALRTLFRDGPDGPQQVVAPPAPASLRISDLSTDQGTAAAALERALRDAAHRPVDLAIDAHVLFTLFVLAPGRHVLSISAHHAAWDGWSNGAFAADLAAAYNAARAGRPASLPRLTRDVADFARSECAALASGTIDAAVRRRCQALAGFPTQLALPTDRPRGVLAAPRGAAIDVRLGAAETAALAALARRSGATPFMAVLAAWALLLARLCASPRLLIGAPVAARDGADEEAVIGYLANTVVIAVDVGVADSFAALVTQVRDRVLEVMADQRVPFEKLVETIAPPHTRATTPLVQTIFSLQPGAVAAPRLDGLEVSVLPSHNEAARYELMLNLAPTPDGALEGQITYASALFDAATVAGWADALFALLRDAPRQWNEALGWTAPPAPAGSHPAVAKTDSSGADDAPASFVTPTERALAVIWGEFLRTAPSGRDDDFFMLGGHSLLLMRVLYRIGQSGLGRIELAAALGATRLSAMAALIDAARGAGGAAATAAAIIPASAPESADQRCDKYCAPAASNGQALPATPTDGVTAPLDDAERRKVTLIFNATAQDYPRDRSIAELWRDAVAAHADRIALTRGDGSSLTYAALDARAEAIADALLASGPLAPTVALATGRGFDAIAAILAIWKAGAAYLPLDAKLPPRVVAQLMADAQATTIVADAADAERLSNSGARLLCLDALPAAGNRRVAPIPCNGGDPAYVMYTSGSTGQAKGVVVAHRAIARLAFNRDLPAMAPGDVMAQLAPLAFDATTFELWTPLLNGATLHIVAADAALEPQALGAALRAGGVSVLWLTSGLFNAAAQSPTIFSGLRALITGGEALSVPHARRVLDACPALRLYNGYGPTENCCFTTLHLLSANELGGAVSVPIGKPIANTRVYIVDEALEPVAIGVWGELVCAGDGVALGYAGQPEQTASAFVTLPWNGEERVYRSGDIARWRRDGVIEFGGRRDGQVKIRGQRIETAAIEALLAQCAGVRDALVAVSGEGAERVLIACVAADSDAAQGEWRRHLAEFLPVYMLPARFIALPALPVNANGKHDRRALQALIDALEADNPAAQAQAAVDYPLAPGQQRLYFLQRVFGDSAAYNVPLAFDVEGTLDPAALAGALRTLEETHHALRLRVFTASDGNPCQRLAPTGHLTLQQVDLRDDADPLAAAAARQNDEFSRPFDLDRESGARAVLLRLAEERWRVVLVLHHAIVDGWSIGVVRRDLAAFYARQIGVDSPENASAPSAAPASWPFEQVALRQRDFAASAEGQAMLARRCAALTPLPAALDLPTDHRRPSIRSWRGGTLDFAFSAEQSAAFDRLARDEAATPFALITALLQTLLHRLTGQDDLALGTLVSGRDRAELQGTVGFLVNTLVLRQQLDPAATFRDLLGETRRTCLQAIADAHCPFEALVDALGVPRDLARNPLFDVLVAWQSDDLAPPELPGLRTRPAPLTFPYAKFDLAFHFGRRGAQIVCQIEYSADLFAPQSVADLFARLSTLTDAVLADPARPLATLPVLPDAERQRVVCDFNATALPLDTRRTVIAPFLDRLADDPSAPAVLAGELTLDYRAFAARAAALAQRLIDSGVRPGQTAAVCAPRSPELLIAIYAILMAGGAYAPLGADQPAARLAAMLDDLDPPLVLTASACRPLVDGGGRRLLEIDGVAEAAAGTAAPCDLGSPDGLAYLLFTSGSTGGPKGVAIEQHSVLNRILWMQATFAIGRGDVILQKTPVTFDVSVWELFWWAWTGAAVALPPPGAERDPYELIDIIERDGVTVMHFVPSMLAAFLACLENGRASAGRLRGLRYVFASGEALDAALVERFNRLLHRPFGVELHNLYGPTEATVDVTWQRCSPWSGDDVVPIGRPLANTQIYVLDGADQPVPIGVAGQIHIGGVQVARGYLKRPELTQRQFIANPFADGRLYRTGDRGRWRRDGSVEYLGRIDRQVKVRGQRIEPGEVERALETLATIERAIVIPVTIDGACELHAYLLPSGRSDTAFSGKALRDHLRQRVSEAMIPARFFRLDALPLSANGKLDRRALSGKPIDHAATAQTEKSTATPQLSQIESAIRALWKTLLPNAEPGPNDGFFDAGGNSLLVVRLHERLNARWPGAFSVTDLFSCATIAAQAQRVAPAAAAVAATQARVAPARTPPPNTTAIAVVGMALRLPGSDDLDAFWRDVAGGADRIRPLPVARQAEAKALRALLGLPPVERFAEAAYLDDVMGFDARRLRLSPADAALLDPQQRLFLDTALRALEDAGRGGAALDGKRVGVFVGGAPDGIWANALMRGTDGARGEQLFVLNVASNIATRLSFLHDWRGPAALIDTACSSSLVALHDACRALRAGECEWALVGAARVMLLPRAAGERLSIDSSTARTHAFADDADGTGCGEGSAVFLLRPLAAAQADGDAMHGVILGSAVNQDGASSGMAAPNPLAQSEVIVAAAADAAIDLASVSYVEAHGTGTVLGDPVEIDGLRRAFAQYTDATGFAAIGSGKGNYGHLDGAAGALGLVRALLALQYDSAPPQPHFTVPNPRIDFARSPVRVARLPTALADRGTPRRAGISAFGLSGINAHVLIEAAPKAARRAAPTTGRCFVVALSAPDAASLRDYAGALAATLDAHPDWLLADIAHTLCSGRDALDARLALGVDDRDDRDELVRRLAAFAATGDAPAAADSPLRLGNVDRAHRGNAAPRCVAVHDDAAQARAAAAAFVAGARLIWPEADEKTDRPRAGRLHLPPAPLARRRCAPELVAHAQPVAANNKRGALLGTAVMTAQGRHYRVDVHAPEFWPAAEHRLDGEPTLVGMAFLTLLGEAQGESAWRIDGLRWIRPLRPAELRPGSVTLGIATDGTASLTGQTLAGAWQTFVEARLTDSAPSVGNGATLDLALIGQRCAAAVEAPRFAPHSGRVEVSARWDCLERHAAGDHEALAWLRRPDGDDQPALHPGLLDVAAGLALDQSGLVPTGCAAIEVYATLPADPVAHVVRQPTADGVLADVCLADRASGRLAVALRGLQLTRLRGNAPAIVASLPDWQAAPHAGPASDDTPLVLIGEGGLAERLAAHLRAGGRLQAHGATVDAALRAYLAGADAPAIVVVTPAGEDAGTRCADLMRGVLAAVRRPTRLLALGQGAFALPGEATLEPPQALCYGVVTVAAQEEPLLVARYVDCDTATEVDALLGELAVLERDPRAVAWRNGRRFVRRFVAADADSDAANVRWPTNGCCVVSGGCGGLALMLAPTLAAGGKVALALLSRHGEPAGDDGESALRRARLETLRVSGLRVATYACDVADRAALAAALARIRDELGPIGAVVHNAGVADGVFLANSARRAVYAEALAAKVTGARLLDELTDGDPLEAFVMAGSTSGLTGAVAHAAYTGANAFLDAFAEQRRRRGKPALTVDWCAIGEMGMAARLLSEPLPSVQAGSDDVGVLLRQALATGAAQVALLDPETAPLLARPSPDETPATEATAPSGATRQATVAQGGARALAAAIAAVWADVLGYATVAADDDFYALGGDSIAGMQIVAQINRELGQTMTLADLFASGTVAALANVLRERAAPESAPSGLSTAPQRERYALSWEQLAVVNAEAAADVGTAYNLPSGLWLPLDIDVERLRAAATRLAERHEILRTRLLASRDDEDHDEPQMAILPASTAQFATLDCADEAALLPALAASVRHFDLWSGVPLRWTLASVAGQPRALLLDIHHVLADALSVDLLLAELSALYAGRELPPPARQFKDYAWWSRAGDGAAAVDAARAYWLDRFQGALPVLDLPADRPRPPRHSWRAQGIEFALPAATVEALRAFAARQKTTPFTVLTATLALLLARYARSDELVIAVPVDSREGEAMARLTGMLVSLLPLRLKVGGDDTVAGLIARTHATHSEALRHRAFGLGQLLAELAPPAAPERPLLAEVTLSYMNFAANGGDDDGAPSPFTPFGLPRRDGKSDLAFFVRDLPEAISIAVEYYADLFDGERIERLGRHLRTLLAALVRADANAAVAALPLIDADEAAWLAAAGQGATPPLPLARGLFALFAQRALATPQAPALRGEELYLSYGDLYARARGIAQALRAAGVVAGDRVALHVERDAQAIVTLLGIVAAGACYVPLDPAFPAQRAAWIVGDADCRLAIADAGGRALLADACPVLAAESLVGLVARDADGFAPPPAAIPAYVMYTSGSSGTPKGVLVGQAAVVRLALGGGEIAVTAADRVMQTGPLAFDASTFEIWATLLNGACLCVASRDEVLDPVALGAALGCYDANVLWLTSGLFNRQVDCDARAFAGLRLLITGGETASAAHCARLLRACPDLTLLNAYGPTENTTFSTVHRVVARDTQPGPVPIGRPIAHSALAVIEPGGLPVPIGVWGEIVCAGGGLAEGYLNRPELDAQRFVVDATGRRSYRSGDLGRWRGDGVLEIAGRLDGQVKLRGFRIELEEIEHALDAHPQIAASAALLVDDGNGGAIVAAIKPLADAPNPARLRDWLGERLPAYMLPSRFVVLDQLPVTGNGKLDRARLAALLPPPSPDLAGEPPRTASERLVADVFAAVFGHPVDSRDTDFIELGGHSLLAIKVVNRIAQATGVRLPMRDFFAAPNVAALAALIDGRRGVVDAIARIADAPAYPLSHAQARLYLAAGMEGAEAAYNITFALPSADEIDPDALRDALDRLSARHETLRTAFLERDGQLIQCVADEVKVPLVIDDLTASTDARADGLRLVRREAATPFALATPPLLRARVIRLGASGARSGSVSLLLLVLHHIVGDGWSSRILLRELARLYREACGGEPAALPPLPIAYRDYAAWHNQRDWSACADYWRAALAGAPDGITLPTDRPAPAVQSHRGDSVTRRLPPELSAGLSAYARQHGVTVATLGLALFSGLLYRLTRQSDLLIGMGVAGRDRSEVEGLIGFFVNVLPIRLRIDDDTEFAALVAQVNDAQLAAMDRRDYPFDLLVRAVAPRRIANRQPLINVVYEYHRFDEAGDHHQDGLTADAALDADFAAALDDAIRPATAKHDLLFFMTERHDACELMLEYDTDLFDRATAERWLVYFEKFVAMVSARRESAPSERAVDQNGSLQEENQ